MFFSTETGNVTWNQTSGTHGFQPSLKDSCVTVYEPGLYGVFCQLTFKFDSGSTDTAVISAWIRGKADGNMTFLQRRSIDRPYLDEETHRTLIVSNLNVFPYVQHAGDSICVTPSPAKAMYVSSIDNTLTLVRLSGLIS